MRPTLPTPIKEYFLADRLDVDAVASCFTDRAVVMDESHTWIGRDGIRQWKKSTTARYRYTSNNGLCQLWAHVRRHGYTPRRAIRR